MKRIFKSIVCAVLITATLLLTVSCGGAEQLKKYESAGLTFYIPGNMEEIEVPSEYADLAYANDDSVEFLIYFYSRDELLTTLYIDKNSSALDYADWFSERNEYTNPEVAMDFVKEYDEEKRMATMSYIYLPDDTYYYDVIFRTDNNLYHVTMLCDASRMEKYVPEFEKWAEKISAKNL